ncbi:hypothetical protein [Pseudonocardia sp. TRM90224]|uniref:hypothetical protein n=1 Tax=Pseudonocardia sp. TRM90224 TaxID=2812678 RepID=UPI001E57D99A|nr:hypothetical protein [Pseudonocardia sp. TRM90224]
MDTSTSPRPSRPALGPPSDAEVAAHLARLRSTLPELSGDAVVSHVSAALLHGLPVWDVPLARVHVTRDRASGGRRGRHLHVHVAPLDGQVDLLAGVAVTSVARTVVDLARTTSFEGAVVTADAALAGDHTDSSELERMLEWSYGWRGINDARRAIGFATPLAGTVGESRSRIAISAAGLPPPVLHWDAISAEGRPIGRATFAWPKSRTIGEYDGLVAYGTRLRHSRSGQDTGPAVAEEKHRELVLQEAGFSVVRWTWPDLDHFGPVALALHREQFR